MRIYFRNDRKCEPYHLSRKLKYKTLWVVLFLFVIFSVYFLLPEKRTDHDMGAVSAELTQVETMEGNITKTSYVNQDREITYAVDKHYATVVRTRDSEGRLLEERYLDENGELTDVWGYSGVSYEHRMQEDIITYLNAKEKPAKTNSGYAVIVRSLNEAGQAVDDMYYDTEMNPVICTGGYYGLHREYDQDGIVSEIVYWDIDRSPMSILSGFAREKDLFDEENRVVQKFYFDKAGNPVCLKLGQAGEAYTYDENNRINQITYLDQEGNSIVTTAGYTILKKSYYRDGTEETNMYFDSSARPMHLSKGQYGIKRVEDITLYLDRNGKVMLCIDNILNGYPFMVVIVGILLCLILCLFPVKLRICTLLAYLIFIFYETLMFRETGDTRANLVLFSYAHTFQTNWRIRVDVINNIWLFVPFGTGLYAIFRKKGVWGAALGLSLAIELIQYFTGLGILELDDLFGNTVGGVIGVGIGVLILHQIDKWRNMSKERMDDSI